MHRLWTLLLSFVLSVSLTGCGGEPQPPAPAESSAAQQTETSPSSPQDSARSAATDLESRSFSYTTEELPAEVDGHAIYGEIYIPEGAGEPMPAVIFSHGYGGTHSIGALPPEIRRIIYTTNIIEGLNRQFRQITKNKPSFTSDDSLRRMLYLASQRIVKHWHARCQNWDLVLSQLEILFAGRTCG